VNIRSLITRLSKGRDYEAHSTAKIYPSARIVNNRGGKGAIRIGAFSHIRGELLTFGHGGEILIGDYCYVGEGSRIWSGSRIEVGNRVLISHCVNIFDNLTHPVAATKRHEQFKAIIGIGHPSLLDLAEDPVMLNDDVLIGCQCVILKGVTIGQGAIVGAGSVVTKDVPGYAIAAGNPARVIRMIPPNER
jgi:acetyltransferase-like isoleucine patch superfamily enzyme